MSVSKYSSVTKTISNLKKGNLPYIFILLLLLVIAFKEVVFFNNPLKWDSIDCFLPWRYHIGECLQNGNFPFWNPFQDLGYPIYADPSSGAWYPLVWFFGYFFGYSPYVISIEFFVHVFIGGVGFFILSKYLNITKNFSLISAVAYSLCGLFIGNAQHLPYIISASWIPFVLLFYFKMMKEKKIKYSILTGVFLSLMVTGGYPAFTIILVYFLMIYFVWFLIKNNKQWKTILAHNFIFSIVTILFSLGLIVSLVQVSPYLSRLGNFSIEQAQFSPFSPQSFISFVFPFSTTANTDFFDSDLSMRNGFFGIVLFVFFMLGIFKKQSAEVKIMFYFGMFSLLASVGAYLPVREFLFDYIPLMNVFRFPSVFRLFFIIPAIIISVKYLQNFFENQNINYKRTLYFVFGSIIILLVSYVFIVRLNGYLNIVQYAKITIFKYNPEQTILQNSVLQALFYVMIFSLLCIGVYFFNKKKLVVWLMFFICLDLVVSTRLISPTTVISKEVTTKVIAEGLSGVPHGFGKMPNITLRQGEEKPGNGFPFWRNYSIFTKKISAKGFNSFSFSTYEKLEDDYPVLYDKLKDNTVVKLGGELHYLEDLDVFKKTDKFSSRQLFFNKEDITDLNIEKIQKNYNDKGVVEIKSYSPNQFEISCLSNSKNILTLHQKYFTYWKAYVNNEPVKIYKSNLNFMSVIVPEGNSIVTFKFENNLVLSLFYIILLLIFMLFTYFIYQKVLNKFSISFKAGKFN